MSRRSRTRASRSSACPSFADDPDAVFVEDTALLLGDHAIITRPGVASRADETEFDRGRACAAISRSTGCDRATSTAATCCASASGFTSALRREPTRPGSPRSPTSSRPLGYEVVAAEAGACLHLKTGATFAGRRRAALRCCARSTPRNSPASSRFAVDEAEPAAANCVRAGDRLILPAGNPAHRRQAARPRLQRRRSRRVRASEGRSRSHLHEPDRRALGISASAWSSTLEKLSTISW